MNNTYLIPANSKKSMLHFGLFNTFDLILFGSGIGISMLLLLILPVSELIVAVLALLPGLVCGFLVFPIPNYHNVRTILMEAWRFYTTRQKYIWRGWCFRDGEEETTGKK